MSRARLHRLLPWALAAMFLLRAWLAASDAVGISRDTGWSMGVAINLARSGDYASFTSLAQSPETFVSPDLAQGQTVQDPRGLAYVPSMSTGLSFHVPQAILFKLLGTELSVYRLWPMLTYTLAIALLLVCAVRLGGAAAALILALWLWV